MARKTSVSVERVAREIYVVRGEQVLLDEDLAALYGVETRVLNQAVTRNRERFPEDFMFRLSKTEFQRLRSQSVISNRGGRRYPPRAFTEQGVAMLSSVLRSPQAILVNIAVIRAFERLRQVLQSNEELARQISRHDQEIGELERTSRERRSRAARTARRFSVCVGRIENSKKERPQPLGVGHARIQD